MRASKRQAKTLNLSDVGEAPPATDVAGDGAEAAARSESAAPSVSPSDDQGERQVGARSGRSGRLGGWSATHVEFSPPSAERLSVEASPAAAPAPDEVEDERAPKPGAAGETSAADPAPGNSEPTASLDAPELPRFLREGPGAVEPVRTSPSAPPRPRKAEAASVPAQADLGFARHSYVIAALAGLAWSGSFVAFVLAFQRNIAPLTYPPFEAIVLAVLTILPAGFMVMAASALRQGARLAAETRRARELAGELITPAAVAALETGGAIAAVREEVERAKDATLTARGEFIALRDSIGAETDRLNDVAADAQRTSRVMAETLGRERDAVASLVQELQTRARDISGEVENQTRLVVDASDLARSQLSEAEATLAARAVSLTTASAEAGARVRQAGEEVGDQLDRLDGTVARLTARLRELDEHLDTQRQGLSNLTEDLKAEQDSLTGRLERQRAELVEAIAEARIGAAELDDASGQSAEALRQLVGAATASLHQITETAESRQAAFAAAAAKAHEEAAAQLQSALAEIRAASEDAVEHASGEASRVLQATTAQVEAARGQAEEISQAAVQHVEAARSQVEQLGELAFDAGQRANQAFDLRIGEARRLIEQSVGTLEEAGARSAVRIQASLDAAHAAMVELSGALADMDVRLGRLPDEARMRAEALRTALERGLGDLAAAARRVVEETQSIDLAFQDRVRRNYETLSEAVRLMGRVAADGARTKAPEGAAHTRPTRQEDARGADERAGGPAAEPEALSSRSAPPAAAPATIEPAHEAVSREAAEALIGPEALFQDEPRSKAPMAAAARPAFSHRLAVDDPRAGPPTPPPVFDRASPRADEEPRAPEIGSGLNDMAGPPSDHEAEAEAEIRFEAARAAASAAGETRLRPRLKLTPTEADEALANMFEPIKAKAVAVETQRAPVSQPAGREADHGLDEWTWTDLLQSIERPSPDDDEVLAEQMIGEIQALGVDAGALLPRMRIEEIASAVSAGDPSAARDSVRRLAPAAVRRLSRRVLTDRTLREQADRYVRRYESILSSSVGHDSDVTAALLSSEPGRAYLLLDAAVGDL